LIKNSKPFGEKFQKTVGGFFLTYTVDYWKRRNLTLKLTPITSSVHVDNKLGIYSYKKCEL